MGGRQLEQFLYTSILFSLWQVLSGLSYKKIFDPTGFLRPGFTANVNKGM